MALLILFSELRWDKTEFVGSEQLHTEMERLRLNVGPEERSVDPCLKLLK
jgi:hypothetical protein